MMMQSSRLPFGHLTTIRIQDQRIFSQRKRRIGHLSFKPVRSFQPITMATQTQKPKPLSRGTSPMIEPLQDLPDGGDAVAMLVDNGGNPAMLALAFQTDMNEQVDAAHNENLEVVVPGN